MHDGPIPIGRRVIVSGQAGSGKSTFSRALAAETGLPLVYLDLHYWKPGWVAPSDDAWRAAQRDVLAGDAWIADGNYTDTLALRLERADAVVLLAMPWWVCSRRALVRGLRSSGGEMPEGCPDSAWRRLRDEWPLALRIWRERRATPDRELRVIAEHAPQVPVHVLRSKAEVRQFLEAVAS